MWSVEKMIQKLATVEGNKVSYPGTKCIRLSEMVDGAWQGEGTVRQVNRQEERRGTIQDQCTVRAQERLSWTGFGVMGDLTHETSIAHWPKRRALSRLGKALADQTGHWGMELSKSFRIQEGRWENKLGNERKKKKQEKRMRNVERATSWKVWESCWQTGLQASCHRHSAVYFPNWITLSVRGHH